MEHIACNWQMKLVKRMASSFTGLGHLRAYKATFPVSVSAKNSNEVGVIV